MYKKKTIRVGWGEYKRIYTTPPFAAAPPPLSHWPFPHVGIYVGGCFSCAFRYRHSHGH